VITNIGKNLLSKYLIGQIPSYASYMAIGCGQRPLGTEEEFDLESYSKKSALEFEMFRVPIVSRGYINENGSSKIIFTAELPTTERYGISEVGIFSSKNNPVAGSLDSRSMYSFGRSENWQFHDDSSVTPITSIIEPLDSEDFPNQILTSQKVFQTNADNLTLLSEDRVARYESTRFLNNTIFLRGDLADILTKTGVAVAAEYLSALGLYEYTTDGNHELNEGDILTVSSMSSEEYNVSNVSVVSTPSQNSFRVAAVGGVPQEQSIASQSGSYETRFELQPGTGHIHLNGSGPNFNRNAPSDEIVMAFSIANRVGGLNPIHPESVKVLLEFASSDIVSNGSQGRRFARFEVSLSGEDYDFSTNRYIIHRKRLEDLYTSQNFDWSSVEVITIASSVIYDGQPSSDFYVCLDGVRFENTSSISPVYGLTGYSVIKNSDALPIVKSPNTSNLIEFRFAIDIDLEGS